VITREFVIEEMLFSEDPVFWGIDLDSNSNIHYVSRKSFMEFDAKYVVGFIVNSRKFTIKIIFRWIIVYLMLIPEPLLNLLEQLL